MSIIAKILKSVLMSLYTYLGSSIVIAVLFMFAYLFIKKEGLVKTITIWKDKFIIDKDFRLTFFVALYISMMLTRTLLCRQIWSNPLSNVAGVWGLYDIDGNLYTENIENIMLFTPFTILVLVKKRYIDTVVKTLCFSVLMSFAFSISIEFLQLFLKLGTWQLSDIVFNSLGGLIGGLLYYVSAIWRN